MLRSLMVAGMLTVAAGALAGGPAGGPAHVTQYPAATWVQVQRLYQPSFVVEVEVTAVFPK